MSKPNNPPAFPDKKLSAEELFKLLENENEWENVGIEILPNGELRSRGSTDLDSIKPKKPITMREDLGGEYGLHEALVSVA